MSVRNEAAWQRKSEAYPKLSMTSDTALLMESYFSKGNQETSMSLQNWAPKK